MGYVRSESIGTKGCVASPLLYGCRLNISTRVKEVLATTNRFITLSRHTSPGKPESERKFKNVGFCS
jgi:hypothetical protein